MLRPNISDPVREEEAHNPRRPRIPVLLGAALALWGLAALVRLAAGSVPSLPAGALIAVFSLVVVLCVVCVIVRASRTMPIVIAFAALGALVGLGGALELERQMIEVPGVEHIWTIELAQDLSSSELSSYGSAIATDEAGRLCRVSVFDSERRALLCKERFVGTIALSPIADGQRERAWQQGACASVDLAGLQQIEPVQPYAIMLGARMRTLEDMERFAGEQAPALSALVCGNRFAIQSEGSYEAYKSCGLAHLIAVSGAHLAIVALVLGLGLRALRVPRIAHIIISAVFVLLYLVFAGLPISAVRAAAMVVLSSASWAFGRRDASLNACALCVIAFIVLDPSSALSVSLFLSAGSTLGIIVFAPLVASWFPLRIPVLRSLVVGPVSMTLASNAVTLPFTMALFSQLSLISVVANVLVAPLFTLACVAGVLASALALMLPALAEPAFMLAHGCSWPLSHTVELLSTIPHASIAVSVGMPAMLLLTAALIVVLWRAWERLTGKRVLVGAALACLVAACACLLHAPSASDEIVMLDVGQGDAILVRSGGKQILVDTGNKDAKLREALGRYGVIGLDAVLITHPDDDHCGSLASLAGYATIGCILVSEVVEECPCAKCTGFCAEATGLGCARGLVGLAPGARIEVGVFSLEVLWPHESTDEGGNGDSLILLVSADCDSDGVVDWKMLLTGDAEQEELRALARSRMLADIDVLKVGHHGSKASLDEEIADLLDPEVSLISVGERNRYGHPSAEALTVLEGCGSQVLRTDEEGCIAMKYNASRLDVTTDAGGAMALVR